VRGAGRSLRSLGGVSNRWTDLSRPPLSQAALRRAIVDGPGPWTSLDVLARVGSTNAELRRRATAGSAGHGAVLTTEHQHAGRGRRERIWVTPPQSSVTVSVLVLPPVPSTRWSWLPLLAGVGVRDTLVRVAGVPAELKWPNDVLVPREVPAGPQTPRGKVCGVLAEVVATPAGPGVVLGLGVNVSQVGDELPVHEAASLVQLGAATTDRDTVLRAVLRAVGDRYEAWAAADGDPRGSGLGAAYREACSTIGACVRVQLPGGGELIGLAQGVDDEGRLLVEGAGGRVAALAAGDVVPVRTEQTVGGGAGGAAGGAASGAAEGAAGGAAEGAVGGAAGRAGTAQAAETAEPPPAAGPEPS
jgi:BirA family transcriptional regulator, biotin operon repressor / biotin---[acetyl-CoA-carboxylase] ligase